MVEAGVYNRSWGGASQVGLVQAGREGRARGRAGGRQRAKGEKAGDVVGGSLGGADVRIIRELFHVSVQTRQPHEGTSLSRHHTW